LAAGLGTLSVELVRLVLGAVKIFGHGCQVTRYIMHVLVVASLLVDAQGLFDIALEPFGKDVV
jgi:hypothetical protein